MLDTSLILFSLLHWFDELPGEPEYIAGLSDLELARQYHTRVQTANLEEKQAPPADCQIMVLYLIRRNYQSVSIICHSFMRDESETQDFSRTLFLLLLDKLRKTKIETGFRSWLARVIKNHFIDEDRRKNLFRQYEGQVRTSTSAGADPAYEKRFDKQNLRAALKRFLDEDEMEIYERRFRLGMKPQEIADELNQEVKSIYGTIYKIRGKIKRNLPNFYVRD